MAVKCNIPNLALRSVHSIIYGFSCDDVVKEIVQNYLEYLKCPGIEYFFCDDFPCETSGGDVFCSTASVNFALESITINTATVSFVAPSQPYVVKLIKVSDSSVIDIKTNPTTPIIYTGLIPATNYNVQLTLLCAGGDTRVVNFPILTMPDCVEIEDYTGVATDVNEYV